MRSERQKIPIVLKLKRFKSSPVIRKLNRLISRFFPPVKFNGTVKRLLIFRNDKIGDAMVTLPVFRDLKLNCPEMKIDVIASEKNRFIFEDLEFIDDIIDLNISDGDTPSFLKIPIIGGFLLFLKFILFPLLFSSEFRNQLKLLRQNSYDASLDLVGLKRNSLIGKYVSGFNLGPGRLAAFIFYDYYLDNNWVSLFDVDFMSRKIELALTESFGFKFVKRDRSLPIIPLNLNRSSRGSVDEFDIIFHLGTDKLRKLESEKVKLIIESFGDLNLLITDSRETTEFKSFRDAFSERKNITFRLFETLEELACVCGKSKLLVCYDGGQAHYLSQYIKTFTIFGPGSAALWKPYEFVDYEIAESDSSGYKVLMSKGKNGHIAVYRDIWCSPCFDTGCKSRPCLNDLSAEFLTRIIKQYCMK